MMMDYGGLVLMHTTISTQFHSQAFIYLYMKCRARQRQSKEREESNKKKKTRRKTEDGSQQTVYWHKWVESQARMRNKQTEINGGIY